MKAVRRTMDYSVELPSPTWKIYHTYSLQYYVVYGMVLDYSWESWLSKFEDMSAQKFVVKRTYQLSLDVIIEQSKCTWCLA